MQPTRKKNTDNPIYTDKSHATTDIQRDFATTANGTVLIDELTLLLLCPVGLVYGGMENAPLASIATLLAVLLSLILIYRLIYLKRIRYHVGSEQLTDEHGVFQRSIGYIELYRVVDFHEQQSLLQQIFGLKTVTVLLWTGPRPSWN